MDKNAASWPSGIKRTKPREHMLAVLQKAEKPLSATEIFTEVQKDMKTVALSTVYRSLEQFVEKGTVTKIAIMNNEVAVYEFNRSRHNHYAVCLRCREMFPLNYCPMEAILPDMVGGGFQITGHNLEIYGYCKACADK